MTYQDIEKQIIEKARKRAESNNQFFNKVTEDMIMNAMRELLCSLGKML